MGVLLLLSKNRQCIFVSHSFHETYNTFICCCGIACRYFFVVGQYVHTTYIVTITDSGFSPVQIEIGQGDSIQFINRSSRQSWPASDPHPTHEFLSGFDPLHAINAGESWNFRFTEAKEWGYHDHVQPHRRGSIIVKKRGLLERVQILFTSRHADSSLAQTGAMPPEVAELLAEKNPTVQAKIVRRMAETYGPTEALDYMQRSGLPFTGETHLLVHEIGYVAYERYGEDALQYCNESFLSACYHGVILNLLADRGLTGVTKAVQRCKDAGPQVFTQCIHAAGHGLLAWKEYEMLPALSLCDTLVTTDATIPAFNCYDGVFMENIFGVHDGKPSPNRMVKKTDPYYPCNAVPDKYRGGCWSNQASLMYQLFDGDLRQVAQQCDAVVPLAYKELCYNNFARQIHPQTQGKTDTAVSLCDNATGAWKTECLLSLVPAAFSVGDRENMSYEICAYLSEKKSPKANACYQTLFGMISSYGSTVEQKGNFCSFVREEGRRTECFDMFHVPGNIRTVSTVIPPLSNQTTSASSADIELIKKKIIGSGVRKTYAYLIERWGTNQVAGHDLAHMLGRAIYDELGVQGFAICDGHFAFGCYHGLLEELIRKEGVKAIPLGRESCNTLSPPGRVASCIHGIGHGILDWKGEIVPALDVCASMSETEREYCADGVFMEYYTGVREGDINAQTVGVAGSANFCTTMPQFQAACVRNYALFSASHTNGDSAATMRICETFSGDLKRACIGSIGLFATQSAQGSVSVAEKVCTPFVSQVSDYALCISSAAQEFIFEGLKEADAKKLCGVLDDGHRPECLQGVAEIQALY